MCIRDRAGLGPRKAMALRQGVSLAGGTLTKRSELIEKNLMGGKVFDNCVGFLKIEVSHTEQDEMLDSTRIHPEVYDLAVCLLYTSPSPRDRTRSRMPSSA
eukprot:TRINITY_DN13646_c0_g1_i1.p1 TRINITY_DN13646_c0_g1~~TRINITY_DN13646_c0_g1_i1.p1  ORF type:complete len:101 (-),score=45.43 TRINITY_DN13646_c0_g1_i1:72-374(-)